MQIIPVDIMKRTNTQLEVEMRSSYSNPFGLQSSLIEKNAHLTKKRSENINTNKKLNFEEILRLKNTVKEKNKISKEEEERLLSLLEQGGEYSIEELIMAMSECGGIQSIRPEEYVSLQQFLQDIGYSVTEIESLTDSMKSQSGAHKAIENIMAQFKEYLTTHDGSDEIKNILPILHKIATGYYSDTAHTMIRNEHMLTGLEQLLAEIDDRLGKSEERIENLSASISQEIQTLLAQQSEEEKSLEYTSAHHSQQSSVEEMRYTSSATEDGLSQFLNKDEHNADLEENMHELFSMEGMDIEGVGMPSSNVKFEGSVAHLRNALSLSEAKEYKTSILETVEQGFVSLKNENMAKITLRLNPYNLGSVELQLQYQDGRMQALLKPLQNDVYHLLKENVPYLMNSLQEQGVHIDAITVVENKGEWLQYQSSREDLQQSAEEHNAQREFVEEQERKERIRTLIVQLAKGNTPSLLQRPSRLLEVIA